MSLILGDGAWVPTGTLDRFKAAAVAHATVRSDILLHGDSTAVGETPGASSTYYSWFSNRLRERFAAAGYTDGGRGFSGRTPSQDFASNSGENLAGVAASSGWGADANGLVMGFTAGSSTVGNTIRFQGKGTYVRLTWRAAQFAAHGKFTYSLDGGAAVTVTPSTGAGYEYVVLGPFTEGTHTLDIANITGATDTGDGKHTTVIVTPDWYRAAGLVWNNHSVSGQSATAYIAANNKLLPVSMGLAPAGATNDWDAAVDASANARKVRLAIFNLGINDADDTSLAPAIHKYALTARQAGADPLVLIPALEDKTPASVAAARRLAIKTACATDTVPYIDLGVNGPLGPTVDWLSRYGIGGLTNPHLTPTAYTKQGDFVADVLLAYLAS